MTNPNRIWATPFDEGSDGGTYCNAENRPTAPNCDAICYVRADLVKALVEAAREVYRISERDHVAWRKLSEALAAFDKT